MATEPERPRKLAVLIDADNTSPRVAKALFEQIAAIGEASVRRIYGDFSNGQLKGWSELLSAHSIVPHQNFATTVGKNATDIALVIDAMDLLYTGRFAAFCIVSSDGDFTRLAARVREQGTDVYGFGERKTPEGFRNACKRFICIEAPAPAPVSDNPPPAAPSTAKKPQEVPAKQPPKTAVPHILTAFSQMQDTDGWYGLGAVGKSLASVKPGFKPKSYGCAKLVTLMEAAGEFEVRRDQLTVYVRPKTKKASAEPKPSTPQTEIA